MQQEGEKKTRFFSGKHNSKIGRATRTHALRFDELRKGSGSEAVIKLLSLVKDRFRGVTETLAISIF